MTLRKHLFCYITLALCSATVSAQNDMSGWRFGLNFGMYYPSKKTANYFNGNPANENNANYVMKNYYWYQEIYNLLDANDTIFISELPQNMHYKLALQPGLYAEYIFNKNYSLFMEFNYMKLKAQDAISFEVDPKQYATEPDLRLYTIRGLEERVYANIGVRRNFEITPTSSWYVTGGMNINNTRVLKSGFFVEDKEYSIINVYGLTSYVPNSNMQSNNIYQGGIGFGMYAGAGAMYHFGSMIMEPGLTLHWLKVNLEGYKGFNPGAGVYVRFIFDIVGSYNYAE